MSPGPGAGRVLVALGVAGVLLAGCRKASRPVPVAAPRPPDAGPGACPPPAELEALLAEPGRSVRTACHAHGDVPYWLGAALSVDPTGAGEPRLQFLSGGITSRGIVFEVEPLPDGALRDLVSGSESVEVRVRVGRGNRSLVRLGVLGRRAAKEGVLGEELAAVLQLTAHAPPRLLWAGAGDRITAEGNCVVEQQVDFQMLFGKQLDMVTSYRSAPGCPGGPGTQEPLAVRPTPLAPGRRLGGDP